MNTVDDNDVTVLPFARFNSDKIYWINGLNSSDIWPGNIMTINIIQSVTNLLIHTAGIPSDGTATSVIVINSGSMTAFTVMCVLSTFGVAWSLTCLIFNIWFRKSM